jgi:hypothetical protein
MSNEAMSGEGGEVESDLRNVLLLTDILEASKEKGKP